MEGEVILASPCRSNLIQLNEVKRKFCAAVTGRRKYAIPDEEHILIFLLIHDLLITHEDTCISVFIRLNTAVCV